MNERPRVGIVDLRDLVYARPWERRYTRELVDALGLSFDWQSFTDRTPCAAMLVVVQRFAAVRRGAWLRGVRDMVVVADERAAGRQLAPGIRAPETATSAEDDAALREMADAEIAAVLGTAPSLTLDGTADSLERVRAALMTLAASAQSTRTRRRAQVPSAIAKERYDGPSGPWLDVAVSSWNAPRLQSRITMLRGHLVVVEDADAPGVPRTGAPHARVVDLATALRIPHDAAHTHENAAFTRDGRFALRRHEQTLELLRVGRASPLGSVPEHGLPFAIDVDAGLAAAGWRCTFDWLAVAASHDGKDPDTDAELDVSILCGCAHDWPVGHAKKLYGYDDNHPRHLFIAPDRGAYVSTFERDAIVSGAVPFRWRALSGSSDAHCALDWPPPDSLRKLFFVADLEAGAAHSGLPAPAPDDAAARAEVALQEDARHHAPIVVVGPSDDHRYALALDEEVWSIEVHDGADEAVVVGGPHEGFAVYDATHRAVRRGRGRLLGGDHDALLVLDTDDTHDDGARSLWREEFVSGARAPLGREDVDVAEAVAIAGRFVLVARRNEDDDRAPVRVRLV